MGVAVVFPTSPVTLRMLPFRLSLVTATGIEDFEEIEDPGDLPLID